MNVFLFILIGVCLAGAGFAPEGQFFDDYTSKKKADALKGICVMLVFFSHFRGYLTLASEYNGIYLKVQGYLGQMIVVPFLFFSGYGITLSIRRKGAEYVNQIPVKRVLRILLHFDLAVLLFVAVNLFLGRDLSAKSVILSLLSWDSIGNSNWYILAILLSYLATFAAFKIFQKKELPAALLLTVLIGVVVAVLARYRADYYCNTMFTYVFGVWYALLKEKIDKLCMKSGLIYMLIFAVCAFVYYVVHKRYAANIWWYNLWAVLFMAIVLLIQMKVSIHSECLCFLGNHIFSIYILQRIPMWILANKYHVDDIPYQYFITSFIGTILLALVFDRCVEKLDRLIFKL